MTENYYLERLSGFLHSFVLNDQALSELAIGNNGEKLIVAALGHETMGKVTQRVQEVGGFALVIVVTVGETTFSILKLSVVSSETHSECIFIPKEMKIEDVLRVINPDIALTYALTD